MPQQQPPQPPPQRPFANLESQEGFCSTYPALRVITMPRDTNHYGVVFGGVILSHIDQAGFVEARKHGNHRWVTVAIEEVVFHRPVRVGDVVNFWTRTTRTGTTSVGVHVLVQVERFETGDVEDVTEATLTYVAVDADGQPIPFLTAPTVSEESQ
ncbi:MAG: acyl-CoA thioesterase [Planctomycetes bacterium]|nr:acyl-CoA thioesterase [Planctomycetota bacterium]NOG53346.1 acyl-CoA thioesterase [Planctomycetota bacterium]